MDSASLPTPSSSNRGRSRGLGRGKPSVPTSPADPPVGEARNVSFTLSSIGRGQGLLPRSPELLTSPPAQMSFTRGRGLGRGTVSSHSPSSSVGSRMSDQMQLKAAVPSVQTPSSSAAKTNQDPQLNGAEAELELDIESAARPPELVETDFECRGVSGVLQVELDSDYSNSDHGDDLTFGGGFHHAMRMAEEDSDDEDLINIGRQLHQRDDKNAMPQLPAKVPETKPAAALDAKKAQQTVGHHLTRWRMELREFNLRCLEPGRDLEGSLVMRWRPHLSAEVVAWLKMELPATNDPCSSALALLNWSSGTTNKKAKGDCRAFPRFEGALECVESVIRSSKALQSRFLMCRNVQCRRFAFFLGQREGMATLRRMIALFQLDDDKAAATMKDLLDKLLENGVYKEACQFIGALGLQHHYSPQQVLLPCIAEGRVNLVEEYVKGNEAAQRQLLRFLDSNYDQQQLLREMLQRCHPELLQVRYDLLSLDALKKLTQRLQKLFQQPNSVVPRVGGERCSKDVAWLLFERYVRRIERSDWATLVERAVDNSPENAQTLVESLIDYRLPSAARRWAEFYSVTSTEVPGLAHLGEMAEEEEKTEEEDRAFAALVENRKNVCSAFYSFPLDPEDDIEFIQDEDELWRAIGLISAADKIGFDAEWTTLYGQSDTPMSLMQIAIKNCVFLLDMDRLPAATEGPDVWHEFREKILEKNQTKIFYSALQDLQIMRSSVPELRSCGKDVPPTSSYRGIVDLEQLVTRCVATSAEFFPSPPSGGLSGLVESCFGRPLSKAERMSNWRARPLTRSQKIYAALDAHCLISLHDWLEARQLELGLRELDLRHPADLEESKRKKKKKKTEPMGSQQQL